MTWGRPGGLIRLLMLNVARYENGSEGGLIAAFRQMSGYGDAPLRPQPAG